MSIPSAIVVLEEVLEAMLVDNEDITARGVTRRQDSPFKNASDITRNEVRAALLDAYKKRQSELRSLKDKSDKQSKTNLLVENGRLKERLAAAEAQRDSLIASHRAMLLAVGEMGGMAAWKRFFSSRQEVLEGLRQIGALPAAQVHSLPAGAHAVRPQVD